MEKTMDKIVALAKGRVFTRGPRFTEDLRTHGITEILVWS